MKIRFCLAWLKTDALARGFKSKPSYELFQEYAQRISHFAKVEAGRLRIPESSNGRPQALWICSTGASATTLSSEALAKKLGGLRDTGIQDLWIVVGGASGIPAAELTRLKPNFLWSFGPGTLPHELACVVAAEQIYRAWTILNHLPYHLGH